jgi:menaquinone-dependent protoporphyrinogen oxidase
MRSGAGAPLVLVAYGSRNGGTAEIARWIAETLKDEGVDAEVHPASAVRDPRPCTAVLLGSGVYGGRWLREAARFARRHRGALLDVPVWLFSSGPLDLSASENDLPPVPGAVKIADMLDAREHVTFGGRLVPGARGLTARMILSRGKGGDFREREQISGWAGRVAREVVAWSRPA